MDKHEIGEPVHVFLARRERELVHQIARLKGELAPREKELAAVRQAINAIGLQSPNAPLAPQNSNAPILGDLSAFTDYALADSFKEFEHKMREMGEAFHANLLPLASLALAPQPTIKQLILRALVDHFKEGASPVELRAYIKDAYGRDIDRGSMGPQLARLRDDGLIEQPPWLVDEGKWRLKTKDTSGQGAYHGVDIVTFNPGEAPGMAFEAKVSAEKPAGAPKVTDGAETPINRRLK